MVEAVCLHIFFSAVYSFRCAFLAIKAEVDFPIRRGEGITTVDGVFGAVSAVERSQARGIRVFCLGRVCRAC